MINDKTDNHSCVSTTTEKNNFLCACACVNRTETQLVLKSFQCYARLREPLGYITTQESAHTTLLSTRTTLIGLRFFDDLMERRIAMPSQSKHSRLPYHDQAKAILVLRKVVWADPWVITVITTQESAHATLCSTWATLDQASFRQGTKQS